MARAWTIAVAITLVVGSAVGAWILGDGSRDDAPVETGDSDGHFESVAPVEERIRRLEQVIAGERDARIVLEDQLQVLIEEIERIDASGPRMFSEQVTRAEEQRVERQNVRRARPDFASAVRNYQEQRLTMLIAGGFSEDQAQSVMKKESEAQYQVMRAAHDAQRNGETVDPLSAMARPQSLLRAELGDSDYERYLQAQGQPTTIQITQVLDGSPGREAGLQPGDQVVSYNGERVFDVNDLRALTMQGRAGEDVVVEIDRDGVRMQLNLPRGPVGISGQGAVMRSANWWGGG